MASAETKNCQNCKVSFTIDASDFDFYSKISVPPPTFCPECRLQRRMAFRNERSLYKDICDLCGKNFVSMYSPDKPFKIYCKECWYSDKWDPLEYGREYDFSRPFFEQFKELMRVVPRIGIMHIHTNLNADYSNYVADSKSVYLSQSVIEKSENVYYSRNIDTGKEIFDCFSVKKSEHCYENVDGSQNYRCKFMYRSRDCIDSAFLFDCINCQDCVMSSNLRNKRFVIRNAQYDKETYITEIKKLGIGKNSDLEKLKKEFVEMIKVALHKFGNLIKTVNCTGDNIDNAKNVKNSFDAYNSENAIYCVRVKDTTDSYDVLGALTELAYEMLAGGYGSRNSHFTDHSDATVESEYTNWCQNSAYLFGCAGLRKKQYCIFNKRYSKESFGELKKRIIAHMNEMPYADKKGRVYAYGGFFPAELSPFAYNETLVQEHFPLTKKEALEWGYAWRDSDQSPHKPTIVAKDLPDDIASIQNTITNEIISCSECEKPYRILKQELGFLKQHLIALPHSCPECRHKARFNLRNPLKLWHRRCNCNGARIDAEQNADRRGIKYINTAKHFHGENPCQNEFESSYASGRPETIYCEQCYNSEVA